MKTAITALITIMLAAAPMTADASAEGNRLNLTKDGVALAGYDPVSYHEAEPKKGKKNLTAEYRGAVYRFASESNRSRFRESPEAFSPAYGGWCAWAMLDGDKVDVDPESYKIIGGKTYLFYNGFFGDTLKKWNQMAEKKPESAMLETADENWRRLLENP